MTLSPNHPFRSDEAGSHSLWVHFSRHQQAIVKQSSKAYLCVDVAMLQKTEAGERHGPFQWMHTAQNST